MKRCMFLTLLCFPVLVMAQMINYPATKQEKELVGEVKALTERVYDVFNGNVKQKRLSTTNGYEFDASGRAVVHFQQYGGMELRYEYTYDDLGKILLVNTFRERNRAEAHLKSAYEYDEQGRMKALRTFMVGVETPTQTYVFTKWDAAGNAIEGELTASGNRVKVFQEFDKMGRRTLLRMVTEGNESAKMRLSLRYDREGRVVERTMAEGLSGEETLKYKYDKKGICVGVNNQKFEYTFDKLGNWIIRIAYIGNQIIGITEREISY